MPTPTQIETALHKWSRWNESIVVARRDAGFRLDFAEAELKRWEEEGGWEKAWELAAQVLKKLVLPSSFASYWVACFCSDYDPAKTTSYRRIRLPQNAKAKAGFEREAGAFLIQAMGTKSYKLDKGGQVTPEPQDPERTLPPYPLEMLIPSIVPFGFAVINEPSETSEVIPIIGIPFAKLVLFTPAPDTMPSPYFTVRIPIFAPNPDWTWLRKQFDAMQRWLKTVGEHPLAESLRGNRRGRFYWKEQAIEKLTSAADKKTAMREVEEIEFNRERRVLGSLSKDEVRKLKTRVRKRVALWAKEAGIT